MKYVYVIGQAPAMTGGNRSPLAGPASHRLSACAGVSRDVWLRRTERVNLFGVWPGRQGKGDAFPMAEARLAADELLPRLEGRPVVLLGGNVAGAFRFKHNLFEWHWHRGFWGARCPHPSGVNRWWNDAQHEAAARLFWRNIFAGKKRVPRDDWLRGLRMVD